MRIDLNCVSRLLMTTLLISAPLAGCEVGPDYAKPNTAVPLTYKELPAPAPGWEFAKPADGAGGGPWWTVFHDPDLDTLEARVNVNNQTIRESEAAYRNAEALVGEARAGLFPTIGVTGSATKQHADHITSSSGTAEATASWDLDVWGRIRRSVESARAGAEVSAADLANARLSEQAVLATTYIDLCYQDSLIVLLRQTVAAYQRSLDITSNQDRFGVAAPTDVITAKTQLESAQSQLIAAGVLRTQYEHAIAALIGVPPVDLTLAPRSLAASVPIIPVAIPSTLLQRRPDIAAAERAMQQENAQIGVNVAAFYPDVSLSALIGYSGTPIGMLFNASNQLWNFGASVTETIFEGGLRSAQVAAARAIYDQAVATYRQTVLTALQGTEDNLSALQILAQQARVQAEAVADAQRAVTIALNEYEAGTQNYTTVVTEQAILLGDQETALQIQQSRLDDTVSLAQDLGGGWDAGELKGK